MADENTKAQMTEKQKVKGITDKPEATLVAGYQAWQKNFERHVDKWEKEIRIFVPALYKIKEEQMVQEQYLQH